MFDDVLHCLLFCFYCFFLCCPCMAINVVSVQYNGGLLPDIILLTQCYFHRGTRLNAMKRFCIYLQPFVPPKRFDIFFPPDWGMLRSSRRVPIFLEIQLYCTGNRTTTICSKLAQLILRKRHNYADSQAHPPAGSQAYRCLRRCDREVSVGVEFKFRVKV